MRQRKAKNLDERLEILSGYMVKDPRGMRGHWQEAFEKAQPLYLELGCGKGKFLRSQALAHEDRNYIGMEGQSTVLLHAMERCEALRIGALENAQLEKTPEESFRAVSAASIAEGRLAKAADPQTGELIGQVRQLEKTGKLSGAEAGVRAGNEMFSNMRFACDFVKNLADYFEKGELAGIYLNFSDPWPKPRHAKRRLTYRGYLAQYASLLNPGRFIEIKTDNDGLFNFTLSEAKTLPEILEIAVMSRDLHRDAHQGLFAETAKFLQEGEVASNEELREAAAITTEYEDKFKGLGKNINYVKLRVSH